MTNNCQFVLMYEGMISTLIRDYWGTISLVLKAQTEVAAIEEARESWNQIVETHKKVWEGVLPKNPRLAFIRPLMKGEEK